MCEKGDLFVFAYSKIMTIGSLLEDRYFHVHLIQFYHFYHNTRSYISSYFYCKLCRHLLVRNVLNQKLGKNLEICEEKPTESRNRADSRHWV